MPVYTRVVPVFRAVLGDLSVEFEEACTSGEGFLLAPALNVKP